VEYLANIVEHVAGAAAHKVQQIHDTVEFPDFSRIQADIAKHPKMARRLIPLSQLAPDVVFRLDRPVMFA